MKAIVTRRYLTWILAGLIPFVCLAVDNVFTGTGLWSDTARWSLSYVPTTNEFVWINGTASLESSQTNAGLNIQGTLDITGSSTEYLSTEPVLIGCSGTNGILTQTDGSFQTTSNFYVGEINTGSVTFTNTDVVLGKFMVAHGGIGSYDQQGGTLSLQGSHALVAHERSVKGTMSITDTTMTSKPWFAVGFTADGKFYATNSIIDCNSDFAVAALVNSKGYAELIGSAIVDCSAFRIGTGEDSVGTVYASQSNITSSYVRVGYQDGIGTLIVDNSLMKTATEFSSGYGGIGCVSNLNGSIEAPILYVGNLAGSQGSMYVDNGETVIPVIDVGSTANATGSLTLASGTIESSTSIIAGNNGVGSISNVAGVIETPSLNISFASSTAEGYMYCGSESVTRPSSIMQVGRSGTGVVDCYGSLEVTGTSGLFLGNMGDSDGTFNLYPGADLYVIAKIIIGSDGMGTFNQYGGDAVVPGSFYAGGYSSLLGKGKGFCNLYGGTLTVSNIVYIGRYGTAELTVSGGHAIFEKKEFGLTIGTYDGSTGTVYLVDGTLAVGLMRDHQGYSQFFFDGGILEALSSSTIFMQGLNKCEVRAGGAKIDTSGDDITITQSMAHDTRGSEPAKDGGLTKLGVGTLIMTGTLRFTGDLGADGGTLNLSTATYSLSSGSGLWGSGILMTPAGGVTVSSSGFIAPGSTNNVGTLTVSGNLTVDGEVRITISDDGTSANALNVINGALTFNDGSKIVIENPELLNQDVSYTIVNSSNFSGTPDVTGLPDNWQLSTRSNGLRIIYNSGTLIIVR